MCGGIAQKNGIKFSNALTRKYVWMFVKPVPVATPSVSCTTRTLGPWVRTPFEERMCIHFSLCCAVLSCAGSR